MRKKISHLLILIYRARLDAEKSNGQKNGQKMDFTGVEIAWVDMNLTFEQTGKMRDEFYSSCASNIVG